MTHILITPYIGMTHLYQCERAKLLARKISFQYNSLNTIQWIAIQWIAIHWIVCDTYMNHTIGWFIYVSHNDMSHTTNE